MNPRARTALAATVFAFGSLAWVEAGRAEIAPAGLIACQAQSDAEARLACYDREMARLHPLAPVATPAPAVMAAPAPPQAAATPVAAAPPPAPAAMSVSAAPATAAAPPGSSLSPEERFGLNGTQLAEKTGPGPAELKDLTAHVVELSPAPAGGVVVDLDNGQRWRQTTFDQDLMLKVGDAVHIRRATLGSFILGAPSGRFAHVARVR